MIKKHKINTYKNEIPRINEIKVSNCYLRVTNTKVTKQNQNTYEKNQEYLEMSMLHYNKTKRNKTIKKKTRKGYNPYQHIQYIKITTPTISKIVTKMTKNTLKLTLFIISATIIIAITTLHKITNPITRRINRRITKLGKTINIITNKGNKLFI